MTILYKGRDFVVNADFITQFEYLLTSTNREGMDSLLRFIQKSDFYSAPASTRYHSCHEGGLLEHSLFVYECMENMRMESPWNEFDIPKESVIISALLHDVCKTYFYGTELKNKKIYSDDGSKMDSNGRYDWQTVPSYVVNDLYPYGHGEKSVMMIENFIKLEPAERYAIRWHMGFTEPKENWNTLSAAIRKYPLVLMIHTADLMASYLLEKEE